MNDFINGQISGAYACLNICQNNVGDKKKVNVMLTFIKQLEELQVDNFLNKKSQEDKKK